MNTDKQTPRSCFYPCLSVFIRGQTCFSVIRLLFANQESIKPETLDATIRDFASAEPQLDAERLDACVASMKAEAVLLRDEKLAETYHVDSAPTIFVNGIRKIGFGAPEAFWSAVRVAAFDAATEER
jgi:protein-disulfide isomerase